MDGHHYKQVVDIWAMLGDNDPIDNLLGHNTMTAYASLEHCSFRPETGTLVIASEFFGGGFPEEVSVRSNHTGNVVRFRQDHEAAIANEFWDGEQCEYFPIDPTNNCKKLVVHHEY